MYFDYILLLRRDLTYNPQTDASILDAALRETHEELGIVPDRVEVLGGFGPAERTLRGDMRVWPYVVGPSPSPL